MFQKLFPTHLKLVRCYSKNQDPFARTWDIIRKDVPEFFGVNQKRIIYPQHADIVVIGGGFIGSSVAYSLKTRAGEGLSVVVLDKDLSFKETKKNISLGTITQHFSLPENVYLSQYSAEFLRNIREQFNSNIDIEYCPSGSLVLASEKYAEKLEHNVEIQKEFGIKNELLTVDEIRTRYPWINTKDISLGCIGLESEGTFNSWKFLKGLVEKAQELGTVYIQSEVTGFEMEQQRDVLMEGVAPGSFQRINRVLYKTVDGEEHAIKFAACVLAAGDQSGEIAKLAKVGASDGLLMVPLPITQRAHNIYATECNNIKPSLDTPLVMDTSGLWFKRNGLGNSLLFGHVPLLSKDAKNLIEDEYYETIIKPSLHNRIDDLQVNEVKKVTTEVYDCNTYDDTGILGPHPYHNNLYIAAGFGKQGCQHAPGVGRAIAELIIDSQFVAIDLTRFSFDRLLTDQPMIEFNVY